MIDDPPTPIVTRPGVDGTASGTATRPSDPAVDALFDGRYRLGRLLGQGGYSRVYEAVDTALGRTVALKVIAGDGADPSDVARVRSEIRLLASVSHPSLVTLYDARLDAAPAYLAMELISGPTLGELIGRGARSGPDTARIGREIAEAFAVIHGRGIVHRDVKPSNVLLRPAAHTGETPRATLADFGIASLVGATRLTGVDTVIGTAAYLSPEQARGMPPAPASDVYSLGLVLLEALTGRRPFAGSTPHEALAARLITPPPLPADVPGAWRDLLARMTSIAPSERPDAAALISELRELSAVTADLPPRTDAPPVVPPLPGAPAPTASAPDDPPPGMTAPTRKLEQASPSPRSRRGLVVTAVVVALLLAAGGAAVAVALGTPPGAPEPSLPSLPQPLDEHLNDLWREVGE